MNQQQRPIANGGEGETAEEIARLRARLEWYETALRAADMLVATQDRELRYTVVGGQMFGLSPQDILGRTDAEILPAESALKLAELKRPALETGDPQDGEITIQLGGETAWYKLHVEPLREAGKIAGVICSAVEITQLKQGEAHLRLLMRELTHRSKNLLAVIQAMARQTARHAGSVTSFLDRFGARLQGLAASHDLLVKENWQGASVNDVVQSQLGHLSAMGAQVMAEGPPIVLKPEAAQSLGLALHELAVNAAKYGALSVPEGCVKIVWKRMPADEGHGLEIVWTEEKGPPAKSPRRRGFGSLVIERNLSRALDAEVELTFPREGARCRIVLPLTQILLAR